MPPPHRKYPSLFWWRGSSSYAPPPHLTLVPLFAAIPVRGAADTKEGGTGREGEGSGGGEQGWHRPWESRARVAMTTVGSEAALSGGAVGWGLAEGSKFGTAPWGRLLHRPSPSLSFLGKYPSSHTPPPHGIAPWPCSPSPGAPLAATPAKPPHPGSSRVLTPQQRDASMALTSGLPRDYLLQPAPRPSQSFLPSPAPSLHPSILPQRHLSKVPACPGPLSSPSPFPRPHLNSH